MTITKIFKKVLLLAPVLGLLLNGCAYVSVDYETISPHEHGISDSYYGRLYHFSCTGNDLSSSRDVQKRCLQHIAKLAAEKGYPYFTILSNNEGVDTERHTGVGFLPEHSRGSFHAHSYNNNLFNSYHSYTDAHYSSTTYVPYTFQYDESHPYKFVYVLLLDESDLKNYKSYYITSDYYNEEVKDDLATEKTLQVVGWVSLVGLLFVSIIGGAIAAHDGYDYRDHYYPY